MKKTRQEALIRVQVSPVSFVRRVEQSPLGPETVALKAGLRSPSPGLAPAAAGRNVRRQRQGGHQAARLRRGQEEGPAVTAELGEPG